MIFGPAKGIFDLEPRYHRTKFLLCSWVSTTPARSNRSSGFIHWTQADPLAPLSYSPVVGGKGGNEKGRLCKRLRNKTEEEARKRERRGGMPRRRKKQGSGRWRDSQKAQGTPFQGVQYRPASLPLWGCLRCPTKAYRSPEVVRRTDRHPSLSDGVFVVLRRRADHLCVAADQPLRTDHQRCTALVGQRWTSESRRAGPGEFAYREVMVVRRILNRWKIERGGKPKGWPCSESWRWVRQGAECWRWRVQHSATGGFGYSF